MTQATTSTVTTTEHRFEVPDGGDMKDLGIAMAWAVQKARDLKIDTSYDDWARISVDGESMAIVVTERKKR